LPPIYASEGTPTIRAEDVLESVGWLSNLGVSVEDAQPEMIDLRVDKLVTEEVPVRVDSGNVLVSDVQLVPPTVSVTAPQRVFAATPTEERFLSVPLTADLAGLPPGPFSKQNVGLRLALGGEPLAQVEPRAVDVSLNIVAETNEFVIEDVRIRLSFTPSFWQQYDQQRFRLVLVEELEWFVQELRVRSASRSIDQLTNADVDAYVLITSDVVNALGVERTLDVNMDLPRGVTLVGQPPQVRVRLEPVQP
jgi:hypothetical protein